MKKTATLALLTVPSNVIVFISSKEANAKGLPVHSYSIFYIKGIGLVISTGLKPKIFENYTGDLCPKKRHCGKNGIEISHFNFTDAIGRTVELENLIENLFSEDREKVFAHSLFFPIEEASKPRWLKINGGKIHIVMHQFLNELDITAGGVSHYHDYQQSSALEHLQLQFIEDFLNQMVNSYRPMMLIMSQSPFFQKDSSLSSCMFRVREQAPPLSSKMCFYTAFIINEESEMNEMSFN